jgi:hypothetical protein
VLAPHQSNSVERFQRSESIATRFDEAGVPTNYIRTILGHTNLTTTSVA